MSCVYGGSCSISSFSAHSISQSRLPSSSNSRPPSIQCSAGGLVAESREQSYQVLCEKYPSFRQRSENVDLVVEISLQPWKVILFSDILTPLAGMNIPFDIVKGKGPLIFDPLSTQQDVDKVTEFDPEQSVPYVGEALKILRKEVDNKAAVLGFVGAPFTLASYVVEGGSSKHFSKIKRLAFSEPKVLHALLQKFTTSMANYIKYQADNGAQAIVDSVKQTHPNLPLILYASGSGGLLERLPLTGVDVVSLDWTVDMAEGRKRLGSDVVVQGNVDPVCFLGRRVHYKSDNGYSEKSRERKTYSESWSRDCCWYTGRECCSFFRGC
ncbi:Uroporphyrinogen decarboxylase chloroplastic [Bienertia sinuspersici]